MRFTTVILLLTLLSFPILWNGISLVHYVVEHSHTFCQSEVEHSHPNPDDCLSIFQLADSENQSPLPATTKSEFQALKQYLTPQLALNPILFLSYQRAHFLDPVHSNHLFSKDVFLPPIFA